MRVRAAVLAAMLAGPGAAQAADMPAGWQSVPTPPPLTRSPQGQSAGGACRIAVPGDWKPRQSGLTRSMDSPDGRDSLVLHEFNPGQDFAHERELERGRLDREQARHAAPRVIEDSPRRFWWEHDFVLKGAKVYEVLIPARAAPACSAHLIFDAGQEALARTIATSLAAE